MLRMQNCRDDKIYQLILGLALLLAQTNSNALTIHSVEVTCPIVGISETCEEISDGAPQAPASS